MPVRALGSFPRGFREAEAGAEGAKVSMPVRALGSFPRDVIYLLTHHGCRLNAREGSGVFSTVKRLRRYVRNADESQCP